MKNNKNNKNNKTLRMWSSQSRSLSTIRETLFLIFAIISIIVLIVPQNGDTNGNVNAVTASNNNNKISAVAPSSISLPLSRGYVNGKIGYFIATDASDNQTATEISNNLGYKVNYAPSLALIPESSRQQGYEFLNGIRGQGAFGFQLPIASKLPEDKGYSPIVQLNFVKWNTNYNNVSDSNTTNAVKELKSVSEIMSVRKNNELTITNTNIIINSPAISVR